jgi:hypothetical protein
MFGRIKKFVAPVLLCAVIVAYSGCAPFILPGPDTTAPTVSSTNPASDATAGTINQRVKASFSEGMSSSTFNSSSFTVTGPGGNPIDGTVSFDATINVATFVPTNNLPPSTQLTATIFTSVTDLSGNQLAVNHTWSFSTGTTIGQTPVALSTAAVFAVLAGSSVTNAGVSSVNGDLGVSPGLAIFGFPPGVLIGLAHADDLPARQAQIDLATAYDDAASRSLATPVVGDLGGLTLAPGLYKSISTLEITSGNLTLDSTGDADAVYIFQVASTFNVADGRQVILNGGVRAFNVFWQVGSTANLGLNSVFKGNILADQTILLNAGASLDGRALTKNGVVDLNTNAVVRPTL